MKTSINHFGAFNVSQGPATKAHLPERNIQDIYTRYIRPVDCRPNPFLYTELDVISNEHNDVDHWVGELVVNHYLKHIKETVSEGKVFKALKEAISAYNRLAPSQRRMLLELELFGGPTYYSFRTIRLHPNLPKLNYVVMDKIDTDCLTINVLPKNAVKAVKNKLTKLGLTPEDARTKEIVLKYQREIYTPLTSEERLLKEMRRIAKEVRSGPVCLTTDTPSARFRNVDEFIREIQTMENPMKIHAVFMEKVYELCSRTAADRDKVMQTFGNLPNTNPELWQGILEVSWGHMQNLGIIKRTVTEETKIEMAWKQS